MKKKALIIIIITTLLFVSVNIAFDCKKAVSDDGVWKIVFVKYPLLDEWEGFAFYRGNLCGDIGEIETCIVKFNGTNSTDYYKVEPENYYGRQFQDPLSLSPVYVMGIKRPNAYSFLVSWDEPKSVIVDIVWNKNDKEKHTMVTLNDN